MDDTFKYYRVYDNSVAWLRHKSEENTMNTTDNPKPKMIVREGRLTKPAKTYISNAYRTGATTPDICAALSPTGRYNAVVTEYTYSMQKVILDVGEESW